MVSKKVPARAATMEDVAKKAGVAISSVSRALSDHPDVSDALKKKVIIVTNLPRGVPYLEPHRFPTN